MLTLDPESADREKAAAPQRDMGMEWNDVQGLLSYATDFGITTSVDQKIADAAALHVRQATAESNGSLHVVRDAIESVWNAMDRIQQCADQARMEKMRLLSDELAVLGHVIQHSRNVIEERTPRIKQHYDDRGRHGNGSHRHELRDQLKRMEDHLKVLRERKQIDEHDLETVDAIPPRDLLSPYSVVDACQKIRAALLRPIVSIPVAQPMSRQHHLALDQSMHALLDEAETRRRPNGKFGVLRYGFGDDAFLKRIWGEQPSSSVVSAVASAAYAIDEGAGAADQPLDLDAWVAQQQQHSYGTDTSYNERMSLQLLGRGLQRKDDGIAAAARAAYWVNRGMGSPHHEVMDDALAGSQHALREMNGEASIQQLRRWVEDRISYLAPKRQMANECGPLD